MLLDTPFPSEPQNDLVPEIAERNAEILERYEQGETVGELAAQFWNLRATGVVDHWRSAQVT
jgi:hypothetical protein